MNMKTWNFSTWSAGSKFFIHFLSFQARQEQRSQNKGTLSWEDAIPLANREGGWESDVLFYLHFIKILYYWKIEMKYQVFLVELMQFVGILQQKSSTGSET